jgi:hypothetical protein
MKSLIATLATLIAVSAFATEAVKPATPATAATPGQTVAVTPKKEEAKPIKSEKKVETKETKTK